MVMDEARQKANIKMTAVMSTTGGAVYREHLSQLRFSESVQLKGQINGYQT